MHTERTGGFAPAAFASAALALASAALALGGVALAAAPAAAAWSNANANANASPANVGPANAGYAAAQQPDQAGGGGPSTGPAGNDGHVQIDDEYQPDGATGNDPHVGCGLTVNFFGFDGGYQTASITVTSWAPTPGGSSYTTTYQLQNATWQSGSRFDGGDSIPWSALAPSFAGVAPAKQGYHVKVPQRCRTRTVRI